MRLADNDADVPRQHAIALAHPRIRARPAVSRSNPLLIALQAVSGARRITRTWRPNGADNDPAKDKQAPLYVAATVEKGAVGDQRVQVTASRLVVVGNSRFVDPQLMDEAMLSLFVNTVDWLGEREALIGIPPKPVKATVLNVPEASRQLQQLKYIWLFGIPAACAFLGFPGLVVAAAVLTATFSTSRRAVFFSPFSLP